MHLPCMPFHNTSEAMVPLEQSFARALIQRLRGRQLPWLAGLPIPNLIPDSSYVLAFAQVDALNEPHDLRDQGVGIEGEVQG